MDYKGMWSGPKEQLPVGLVTKVDESYIYVWSISYGHQELKYPSNADTKDGNEFPPGTLVRFHKGHNIRGPQFMKDIYVENKIKLNSIILNPQSERFKFTIRTYVIFPPESYEPYEKRIEETDGKCKALCFNVDFGDIATFYPEHESVVPNVIYEAEIGRNPLTNAKGFVEELKTIFVLASRIITQPKPNGDAKRTYEGAPWLKGHKTTQNSTKYYHADADEDFNIDPDDPSTSYSTSIHRREQERGSYYTNDDYSNCLTNLKDNERESWSTGVIVRKESNYAVIWSKDYDLVWFPSTESPYNIALGAWVSFKCFEDKMEDGNIIIKHSAYEIKEIRPKRQATKLGFTIKVQTFIFSMQPPKSETLLVLAEDEVLGTVLCASRKDKFLLSELEQGHPVEVYVVFIEDYLPQSKWVAFAANVPGQGFRMFDALEPRVEELVATVFDENSCNPQTDEREVLYGDNPAGYVEGNINDGKRFEPPKNYKGPMPEDNQVNKVLGLVVDYEDGETVFYTIFGLAYLRHPYEKGTWMILNMTEIEDRSNVHTMKALHSSNTYVVTKAKKIAPPMSTRVIMRNGCERLLLCGVITCGRDYENEYLGIVEDTKKLILNETRRCLVEMSLFSVKSSIPSGKEIYWNVVKWHGEYSGGLNFVLLAMSCHASEMGRTCDDAHSLLLDKSYPPVNNEEIGNSPKFAMANGSSTHINVPPASSSTPTHYESPFMNSRRNLTQEDDSCEQEIQDTLRNMPKQYPDYTMIDKEDNSANEYDSNEPRSTYGIGKPTPIKPALPYGVSGRKENVPPLQVKPTSSQMQDKKLSQYEELKAVFAKNETNVGPIQKQELAPETREAKNLPLNEQSMEQEFLDLDIYQPVANGYKVRCLGLVVSKTDKYALIFCMVPPTSTPTISILKADEFRDPQEFPFVCQEGNWLSVTLVEVYDGYLYPYKYMCTQKIKRAETPQGMETRAQDGFVRVRTFLDLNTKTVSVCPEDKQNLVIMSQNLGGILVSKDRYKANELHNRSGEFWIAYIKQKHGCHWKLLFSDYDESEFESRFDGESTFGDRALSPDLMSVQDFPAQNKKRKSKKKEPHYVSIADLARDELVELGKRKVDAIEEESPQQLHDAFNSDEFAAERVNKLGVDDWLTNSRLTAYDDTKYDVSDMSAKLTVDNFEDGRMQSRDRRVQENESPFCDVTGYNSIDYTIANSDDGKDLQTIDNVYTLSEPGRSQSVNYAQRTVAWEDTDEDDDTPEYPFSSLQSPSNFIKPINECGERDFLATLNLEDQLKALAEVEKSMESTQSDEDEEEEETIGEKESFFLGGIIDDERDREQECRVQYMEACDTSPELMWDVESPCNQSAKDEDLFMAEEDGTIFLSTSQSPVEYPSDVKLNQGQAAAVKPSINDTALSSSPISQIQDIVGATSVVSIDEEDESESDDDPILSRQAKCSDLLESNKFFESLMANQQARRRKVTNGNTNKGNGTTSNARQLQTSMTSLSWLGLLIIALILACIGTISLGRYLDWNPSQWFSLPCDEVDSSFKCDLS